MNRVGLYFWKSLGYILLQDIVSELLSDFLTELSLNFLTSIHQPILYDIYSGGNSYCNKALFMKQKCQIQIGVGQYKNAATPLRTGGINITHQHLSQGAQKLLVKVEM